MDDPNPPSKHCYAKVQYLSRKAARRVLKVFRPRDVDGHTLHVYTCPTCKKFHIGNDRKKAA